MRGETARRECGFCGTELPDVTGPGRRRSYCGDSCRRQAQRRREREKAGAVGEDRRSLGQELAAEVHRLAGFLLEAAYAGDELGELVQRARAVESEVGCFLAAVVTEGRARGAKWEEVAKATNLTSETARTKWSSDRVRRLLDHRALVHRATPLPTPRAVASLHGDGYGAVRAAASAERAEQTEQAVREPVTAGRRLAAALSQIHRESSVSIRQLADHTMLSPSFISRVLSGERLPSWDLVCHLSDVLGQDPRELRLLCEVAHGITQPPRQTVTEHIASLKAALRGLHLAAARPTPQQVQRRSKGKVPAEVVTQVLQGDLVPEWEILGALVTALGGWAADFKPLWEAVHYSVLMTDDPSVGDLATEPYL
ncbi:helix-turn-helix domain-containing protein [Streptomyces sp. DT24]|uniref:helix-turn-helix domain-containing protein n=1 Tax=unclassified Streptomyces TaxID=2593676 RepID=UPI0023B8E67B|nr:helix-turn-helix transcriptional regulator [Streptomyces sp. AM 4-1-1]WEH37086.1 helix-turn-helix transcriptional regulator [Streptomyces sp. AM 4-1-1]